MRKSHPMGREMPATCRSRGSGRNAGSWAHEDCASGPGRERPGLFGSRLDLRFVSKESIHSELWRLSEYRGWAALRICRRTWITMESVAFGCEVPPGCGPFEFEPEI